MRTIFASAALLLCAWTAAMPGARAQTPGVTDTSIKIGMFGPLTGVQAFGAKAIQGVAAIYKDVNDKGGINGRKIELIIEDDACDPNKSISAVKKLIAQEQVFMVHGGWCSPTILAAKPELTRDPNLPFMVMAGASTAISTPVSRNIFHPVVTTLLVARSMVNFALTKPGNPRIAIIGHSDEWGKSQVDPALADLKAKGMEPAELVYFERGSVDSTSQTLKLREAKPNVILAFLYPTELGIFLRDAYKYGVTSDILAPQSVSLEDTAKRVGIPDAVKNLYVFYPLADTIDSPAMAKWADIVKKYYPGETLDTVSFLGMSGALAVVETLRKLGPNVTREGFIAQLDGMGTMDFGIQSAPMTFTPQDHAGVKAGKMIAYREGKATIIATLP